MADILVLCYHGVSDTWPANMAIARADLEAQVRQLLAREYRGDTFSSALGSRGRGRTLAVTFDDSLRSVYDLAFPLLRQLGIPGTVYVPTGFVGAGEPVGWPGVDGWLAGSHAHELLPMEISHLEELADAGWEIGAHTHTHPRLPELGDAELAEELDTSKERLESVLDRPCRSVAFPYGAVDVRVARAASAAGFEYGAGLAGYENRVDPMRWPRINVNRGDSRRRFSFKVSPLSRRLRLARAREALSSRLPRPD